MGNITMLLGEIRAGNAEARSALFTQVYAELTRLARSRLSDGETHQLDARSLVHEAYLRLSEQELTTLQDRNAFFAYSAVVMRNVVIDTVRRGLAQKRGAGATQVTLSGVADEVSSQSPDVLALHAALELLGRVDERGHRIVEMRYFAGMTNEEIAEVLEVSAGTVKRSWDIARRFLLNELAN